MMTFRETRVAGAFVIEAERHEDERGFFARTFSAEELGGHGLDGRVAESSLAYNLAAFTLRGLHYQRPPHEETKLVRCTRGSVYDVVVEDVTEDAGSTFYQSPSAGMPAFRPVPVPSAPAAPAPAPAAGGPADKAGIEQGDIIVTEESAKKMSQPPSKTAADEDSNEVAAKPESTGSSSSSPSTGWEWGSAGGSSTSSSTTIRTLTRGRTCAARRTRSRRWGSSSASTPASWAS